MKTGVEPTRASDVLCELIRTAGNVIGQAIGPTPKERITSLREAYLTWNESVVPGLEELSADPEIGSAFLTDRSWRIRELHADPRPFPLVNGEIRQHVTFLHSLLDDLHQRIRRASRAPGHMAVLDTNVLLHYMPPTDVVWADIVGKESVRIVLPLRVIEELDAKKYARRDDLAERARTILPQLRAIVGRAGEPGELRARATLEVLVEPGPRSRPTDADEEILDTCIELREFCRGPLTLITGDTSMQLRAEALDLEVVQMPAKYLRRSTTASN